MAKNDPIERALNRQLETRVAEPVAGEAHGPGVISRAQRQPGGVHRFHVSLDELV